MRKHVGSSSFMRQGIKNLRVSPWKVSPFSVREVGEEADLAEAVADLAAEVDRGEAGEAEGSPKRKSAITAKKLDTMLQTVRGHPNAMSVEQLGTKAISVQTEEVPHQVIPSQREGKEVLTMWS